MTTAIRNGLLALFAALMIGAFSACDSDDGAAEEFGEKVDETTEEVEEEYNQTKEDIEDSAEDDDGGSSH
ncbi:hypothetical protein [uncultured Abyssibacter sp.]|uniref:hypothetical protein n=1 Tax=uncultured Abyssibacter sp. TaxID=2320202 RepID=UPI0032B25B42